MWICLNDAFVSAVQDEARPGGLKVRARRREHLVRLFPGHKVHRSLGTDYEWRVFVSRDEFAALLAGRAAGINYDNFKDSVEDDDLHDLYARFWALHLDYQTAVNTRGRRSPPRRGRISGGRSPRRRRPNPPGSD